MSAAILSVKDLTFTYSGSSSAAVKGVSFNIEPGTVTAILGPNGAGKTTLLHLLLGIQLPLSGSIFLDEQPLRSYSRRNLSRLLGLVPQSEYVPFEYSVIEYVTLGRAPYLGPLELPDGDLSGNRQSEDRFGRVDAMSSGQEDACLVAGMAPSFHHFGGQARRE